MYKFLQITVLFVALLSPWIYFVGYAYDWGYLDSFSIERQMFFKAPQEYFGLTFQVFLEIISEIPSYALKEILWIVFTSIALVTVIALTVMYWGYRVKLWPRIFLRSSNFAWRLRGLVTKRFMATVAVPGYLFPTIPVIFFAVVVYILLCGLLPPFVGYTRGQKDAAMIQQYWPPNKCTFKAPTVGCTQLIDGKKAIAIGKLIAASDKLAAIYDGNEIRIYSLRNRELRTELKVVGLK